MYKKIIYFTIYNLNNKLSFESYIETQSKSVLYLNLFTFKNIDFYYFVWTVEGIIYVKNFNGDPNEINLIDLSAKH